MKGTSKERIKYLSLLFHKVAVPGHDDSSYHWLFELATASTLQSRAHGEDSATGVFGSTQTRIRQSQSRNTSPPNPKHAN